MSWVISEVLVEQFLSDGSHAVVSIALKAHSSIVSVYVWKYNHKLCNIIEV